jgi:8-oxo-dGTP pyrophosphatase MutT (NUDIX family)
MLFRQCAGGIVFSDNKVLILQNEKQEWVFPKGVIRNGSFADEVAIDRVFEEAGVSANIIAPVGETSYEFFSISRQQPVCNQIQWFLIEAPETTCNVNAEQGFLDGGFMQIEEALQRITYSQDKSLLNIAVKKMQALAV